MTPASLVLDALERRAQRNVGLAGGDSRRHRDFGTRVRSADALPDRAPVQKTGPVAAPLVRGCCSPFVNFRVKRESGVLEVCEVGNSVGKEEYEAAIPTFGSGLINAQYDLRDADFPVIIWIAGDDRLAANELVNRLNEWMDSFADTRVFADPTDEGNTSARTCGGCGARCHPRAGPRSLSAD